MGVLSLVMGWGCVVEQAADPGAVVPPSPPPSQQQADAGGDVLARDVEEEGRDGERLPGPEQDEQLLVELVRRTNAARAAGQDCKGEYGWQAPAPALVRHPLLDAAAQGHAQDMARNDFVSHEGSDQSRVYERIVRTGYEGSPVGENIITGLREPEKAMDGWLDSPGHCYVMMNTLSGHIGVGIARAPTRHGIYWVQVFAE